ncbi:MAG: YitT family protein, partial [Alistipes sp.]|nr:YitT family protein [Alistipes sp.]
MAINLTPSTLGRSLKEYVIMTLGMFCYAFGWVACIIPAGGMGGGATGLSMILNHFFP